MGTIKLRQQRFSFKYYGMIRQLHKKHSISQPDTDNKLLAQISDEQLLKALQKEVLQVRPQVVDAILAKAATEKMV